MDYKLFKDEKAAKKLISSYKDVDRCVEEDKFYEATVWNYILGTDSLVKLENVIEGLFKEFSKKKGIYVHEIHNPEFFVFSDKNHPWFKERYEHKTFY